MYLVLSALTSNPISLAAATKASAFCLRVCILPPRKFINFHVGIPISTSLFITIVTRARSYREPYRSSQRPPNRFL